MPWTMNDYPSSFKNLTKATKKKAIDIANAMVDEGYEENKAIPIATKQAKEWYNDTSTKEQNDYLKHGQPTKHASHYESNPALLDKPELVVPHHNQWAVQAKDAKKPTKVFENKSDAIHYGKSIAKNKQSKLIVYRQDESVENTFDY